MRNPAPGLPSLLEQAMGCAASAAAAKVEATKPVWPLNPFPKGIRPGSATALALQALEEAYPCWLEHWELMRITNRSRGAVAWALGYLAEHDLVRSIPSARHPQYLRYRAAIPVAKQPKEDADD